MENTEQLINIYHTGFIVCAVLLVVGIALAVACFFMFDIKNIFMLRTGRAKQQTIAEMQARNQKTGKLSMDTPYTDSGSLKQPGKSGNAKKSGALKSAPKRPASVEPPVSASKKPVVERQTQSMETQLLTNSNETVVESNAQRQMPVQNYKDPMETEVLASAQRSEEPVNVSPGFRFTITERTIVIHTTENV